MVYGEEGQRVYLLYDVHVFSPFVPSNAAGSLSACYRKHENIKKRAYGQWIRLEKLKMLHLPLWSCLPLEDSHMKLSILASL